MLGHPPEDPLSIFVNGKLKPGTYNVQNLVGQTYLEVLEHSRELCCRPSTALSQQDGLWEFKVSGSGYTIKKVEPGKPNQFCNAQGGLFFGLGSPVSATAFPAAWRVELVDDILYRGFGYVRIFWGATNKTLDLNWWGSSNDGTTVRLWEQVGDAPWRIWKLIPVRIDSDPPTRTDAKVEDEPPPEYSDKWWRRFHRSVRKFQDNILPRKHRR